MWFAYDNYDDDDNDEYWINVYSHISGVYLNTAQVNNEDEENSSKFNDNNNIKDDNRN